jgi:hypothetical protein
MTSSSAYRRFLGYFVVSKKILEIYENISINEPELREFVYKRAHRIYMGAIRMYLNMDKNTIRNNFDKINDFKKLARDCNYFNDTLIKIFYKSTILFKIAKILKNNKLFYKIIKNMKGKR